MNNNNIWNVFSYELRRNITRKGFLFTTFGLPIIAFAFYFGLPLITGGSSDTQEQLNDLTFELEGISKAGYVDNAGFFPEPGELAQDVMIRYTDEEAAQAALDDNTIDVYYVIAADYAESGDVMLVLPRFSIGQINQAPFDQLFYSQFADKIDQETLIRLVNPAFIETVNLSEDTTTSVNQEDVDNTVVQLFAILYFLAVFGTNGYLMQSVIEEKESRLVEILISSVRPVQLLMGKIFALGLLGLFQLGVYVFAIQLAIGLSGSDTILSNVNLSLDLWLLVLVYFVLGYLMFAAIFGAIGAISTSISEGPTFTAFFVIPALSPWFLATEFAAEPNGPVATVMSLFPLTAPMGMIMRSTVTDVPVSQLLLSIGLLIITVGVLMWFAGRLFRVNTLLSGRVPKLRELPLLLRG